MASILACWLLRHLRPLRLFRTCTAFIVYLFVYFYALPELLATKVSDVVPRGSASARGCLEADFYCLGLGLGLQCLGLGLESWCLGLVTRPRPRH